MSSVTFPLHQIVSGAHVVTWDDMPKNSNREEGSRLEGDNTGDSYPLKLHWCCEIVNAQWPHGLT